MSTNSRYKTHTGREFNMSAFAEQNGGVRAVGNVSMNARGDIIDAKGNVTIPSQTISRAVADLKNNDSKQVSLKADETIIAEPTPVAKAPVAKAPTVPVASDAVFAPAIVSERDITTPDGIKTEIEYADGSFEILNKKTKATK